MAVDPEEWSKASQTGHQPLFRLFTLNNVYVSCKLLNMHFILLSLFRFSD